MRCDNYISGLIFLCTSYVERALSRDCMSHTKRSLGLNVFCGVNKRFLSLAVCSQKS
jgi:hypothetical protein